MGGQNGDAVYMIGNAHIDPVWIWDWQEGMHEVWSTFRAALDRLKEFPEFCFTASSAAYYAWIEAQDPEMFAEIQAYVAKGRWHVVGGMWVEPDCNLPSGESFVRHLLYSQTYFRRVFGQTATVGYNIDSFGHNIGLPQILDLAGLKYYVMMRPMVHEKPLPGPLFRWRSPDGTEVLTYRLPEGYTSPGVDQEPLRRRVEQASRWAQEQQQPMMIFYGVGNHGGGPTRETIQYLQAKRERHPSLQFGGPEDFFAAFADPATWATLPVVESDLQHHASGCYAVTGWVKAANYAAETALMVSEQLDTVAHRLFQTPPETNRLAQSWKYVLFNQFHDILAGTSSEAAYASVRNFYGFVQTEADTIGFRALDTLTRNVDTRFPVEADAGDAKAESVVVYNPWSWPVDMSVRVPRPAEQVFDSEGRRVFSQAISSRENTRYATHTLFVANVPALGYGVYRLAGGYDQRIGPAIFETGRAVLENQWYRVRIDADQGVIRSIWDVDQNREWVADEGIYPVLLADDSDTWSHGVFDYGAEEIPFHYVGAAWTETGPVRSTITLTYTWQSSHLTLAVTLYRDLPYPEIRGHLDWHEGHHVVKLRMAWKLAGSILTHAGAAYAVVDRTPNGQEEPVQGFLAMEGSDQSGVAVLLHDRYSYDARRHVFRPTILRSPRVADHGQHFSDQGPFTDQGASDFCFRIVPFCGTWQSKDMFQKSMEWAEAPRWVIDSGHAGRLAPQGSFLTVLGEGVMITAMKRAERQDGMIIRLFEGRGRRTVVAISGALLGERHWQGELGPYQLATLRIPDAVEESITMVDLLEEPVAGRGA